MKQTPKEAGTRPLLFPAPKNSPALAAAALASYPLAYLYVRNILFAAPFDGPATRWGPLLFAVCYLALTELLARAARRPAGREARLWVLCWLIQSGAILAVGLHIDGIGVFQSAVWHLTAIWYVLSRTGMLAAGRSGSLAPLDALTGIFVIPFGHFGLRITTLAGAIRAWAARRRAGEQGTARRLVQFVLSAAAALALGAFACGQLARVDQNFARLWQGIGSWLDRLLWNNEGFVNFLVWFTISVPVGAWLFGLAGGAASRQEPPFPGAKVWARIGAAPRLTALTANLMVGVLCGVYALFFGVQAAGFAAALGAPLPLTAPDAAAFAVNGFWELCRVMALDLAVLALLFFLGDAPLERRAPRRVLLAVFCGFGVAFALLAAVKLGVYTVLFGLTPKRVWSAWVLAVLLLTSILAWVRLYRPIPAARIALAAAAVSFTVLCCLPVEWWCVQDQTARHLAGQDYDWSLLRRCAGQSTALAARIRETVGAGQATRHGI